MFACSLDELPFQNEEFDFVYVGFLVQGVVRGCADPSPFYRHIKRIALGIPEDKVCSPDFICSPSLT